jgi:hypothetical protein
VICRLLIVGLLLVPVLSQAGVYRWVDEKGQVHFGSVPPQPQSPYKVGDNEADTGKQQNHAKTRQAPSTNPPAKDEKVANDKKDAKDKSPARQTGVELDRLIKRLRSESKKVTPHDKPLTKRKAISIPDAASKPSAKKSQAKPHKGTKDEQSLHHKQQQNLSPPVKTESKPAVSSATKPESKNTKQAGNEAKKQEKYAEMCGVFTDYVQSYQQKVGESCPGAHCAVYQRQLRKYQLKVNKYCK